MRKRPVRLVVMVVVFIAVGRAALPSDPADLVPPPPATAFSGSFSITVPEVIEAGASFEVVVEGATPEEPVLLIFEGGYGHRNESVTPSTAAQTFEIAPFEGAASGAFTLTAVHRDEMATRQLEILPGRAVDPIPVYLGPVTVNANGGESFVMEVAIPNDRFGNPVVTGTVVDFEVFRADQRRESFTAATERLLASVLVESGTVAGRTRVAATAGDAAAPERDFLEVAGAPRPFSLNLLDPLIPADGHALVTIATDVLVDRFDNVVSDGVSAVLDIQGTTGPRRLHSEVIDGIAEFTVEVPATPGSITALATVSRGRSEPFRARFPTAVARLDAEIELTDRFNIVHVGPVKSVRGSFVPEGTAAAVETADGQRKVIDLSNGVASAFFPVSADMSQVTVEVLGAKAVLGASNEATS